MQPARLLSLLALLLLVASACQTSDAGKDRSTASVISNNQSPAALGQAVLQVFNAEGYTSVQNSRTDFVFERPAGTWGNIAYGSMMNPNVWYRVKVHIESIDATTHRLTADAFRIRDKGASLEEQEHLGRAHARGYRELLESVLEKARGTGSF